jgi:hypothetical protein
METGILTFPVDGRWTLDDLNNFAHSFRLSYAYFYVISDKTDKDDDRVRLLMSRYFWSGTYEGDEFASKLYFAIPEHGQPYIRRFSYASPGAVEIGAIIAALGMMSKCVQSWIKTGRDTLELYKEVTSYFQERRLQRIPKNFDLDQLTSADIDAARTLCFEMGQALGLAEPEVERVLQLTGNPISGLKLLAQIAHETEKLGRLDRANKAKVSASRVTPDPVSQVEHRS